VLNLLNEDATSLKNSKGNLNLDRLNVVSKRELIAALFKTTLLRAKNNKLSKLSEVQIELLKDLLSKDI